MKWLAILPEEPTFTLWPQNVKKNFAFSFSSILFVSSYPKFARLNKSADIHLNPLKMSWEPSYSIYLEYSLYCTPLTSKEIRKGFESTKASTRWSKVTFKLSNFRGSWDEKKLYGKSSKASSSRKENPFHEKWCEVPVFISSSWEIMFSNVVKCKYLGTYIILQCFHL